MAFGVFFAAGAAALAGAAWYLQQSKQPRPRYLAAVRGALNATPGGEAISDGTDLLGRFVGPGGGQVLLYGDEDREGANLYAVVCAPSGAGAFELASALVATKAGASPHWPCTLWAGDWSARLDAMVFFALLGVAPLKTLCLGGAEWALGSAVGSIYTARDGLCVNVYLPYEVFAPEGRLALGRLNAELLPWLERLAALSVTLTALSEGSPSQRLIRFVRSDLLPLEVRVRALEQLATLRAPLVAGLEQWLCEQAPLKLLLTALGASLISPRSQSLARLELDELVLALDQAAAGSPAREALVVAVAQRMVALDDASLKAILDEHLDAFGELHVALWRCSPARLAGLWRYVEDEHSWDDAQLERLWSSLAGVPVSEQDALFDALGSSLRLPSSRASQDALKLFVSRFEKEALPWSEPWEARAVQALLLAYGKGRAQWSAWFEINAPASALPRLQEALKLADSELDKQLLVRLIASLYARHGLDPRQGALALAEDALPLGALSVAPLEGAGGAISLTPQADESGQSA